jgi:protein phosphatase
MKETVQVDVVVDQPRPGDVYLLCSDGLSGMVTDREMAEIVSAERDVEAACAKLILAANDHGGVDNITALLARVDANA